MSDLEAAKSDPEALLWKELGKVHAGMLGVAGSGEHMQPMAHHADPEGNRLWFLTKSDTDLFQSVGADSMAHFCVISKPHDFHACLKGRISHHTDHSALEDLWNPMVAAWFDGKDDPKLRILVIDLQDAAIWASTGSTLAFAWETAKANLTGSMPDVGVRNDVVFA